MKQNRIALVLDTLARLRAANPERTISVAAAAKAAGIEINEYERLFATGMDAAERSIANNPKANPYAVAYKILVQVQPTKK